MLYHPASEERLPERSSAADADCEPLSLLGQWCSRQWAGGRSRYVSCSSNETRAGTVPDTDGIIEIWMDRCELKPIIMLTQPTD